MSRSIYGSILVEQERLRDLGVKKEDSEKYIGLVRKIRTMSCPDDIDEVEQILELDDEEYIAHVYRTIYDSEEIGVCDWLGLELI